MANKFNFVVFEDVGAKRGNNTISVSRNGAFGFNAGFYRSQNLKDYSHVILSYDAARKAVGFHFTKNQKSNGVWKISHGKSSASVVARSFFRAFSIEPTDYAGRYQPRQYSQPKIGKLFYIILQKKTKAKG